MLRMECETMKKTKKTACNNEENAKKPVWHCRYLQGEHIYFNKVLLSFLRLAHAEHHKDSYCRLQGPRDRGDGRGPPVIHS